MKLYEVLDKPFSYNWHQKLDDDWYGRFNVGENDLISVTFEEELSGEGAIEIVFSRGKRTGAGHSTSITNTGEQFKIFATVMAMTKEYVKQKSPDKIKFSAKEDSRIKLYGKLIKKYSKSLGYKVVDKRESSNGLEFRLEKL
jgi:hypothetical protein